MRHLPATVAFAMASAVGLSAHALTYSAVGDIDGVGSPIFYNFGEGPGLYRFNIHFDREVTSLIAEANLLVFRYYYLRPDHCLDCGTQTTWWSNPPGFHLSFNEPLQDLTIEYNLSPPDYYVDDGIVPGEVYDVVRTYEFLDFAFYAVAEEGPQIAWRLDITRVPEPATWGLLILGFGAAGAMLRRRGEVTTT